MKKIKVFTIVYILFACFFLFPIIGKADPIKSGTDACVNDSTCLQVCEWDNNGYHAYAYYYFADQSWKYVWYYQYNPFRAERKGESLKLPTKNIFYENDTIKTDLSTKGVCPAGAYVDQDGIGTTAEFCLDTGKVVENKNGKTKSHCVKTASNFGTTFQGTSKLVYNINDHIRIYFENHAIPELDTVTCDSLADSTGYAIDDSKTQPLLDKIATDFGHNFLYDNQIPTWMKNGSYKEYMEVYKRKLGLKVSTCNIILKNKAQEDLNSGNITQDEFNQAVENGTNAEQNVQDRVDQLEENITTGNNPSSPTYTPNAPNQNVTEADCNSLLGTETQKYLNTALTIIQIVGVVLAILLGMGDFIGSLLSGESDSNKKAFKKFIIRIAMAAVLLIVPALLKFVLNTFGIGDGSICIL